MDTNLPSSEELDNWCFRDIKVIAETHGISVPGCRLQAVCIDLRATCSRFEKIKNKFCHYWGQCAVAAVDIIGGNIMQSLLPDRLMPERRSPNAATRISASYFLFSHFAQKLPWQKIQSWAFSLISILIEVSLYKTIESEQGKRPQIELSYCQSLLCVILSLGATVNILIEASLVS